VDNPFDTNKENNNNLLNSATFNMSIISKKPQEVAVLQKPKNSQMPVKTVFNSKDFKTKMTTTRQSSNSQTRN